MKYFNGIHNLQGSLLRNNLKLNMQLTILIISGNSRKYKHLNLSLALLYCKSRPIRYIGEIPHTIGFPLSLIDSKGEKNENQIFTRYNIDPGDAFDGLWEPGSRRWLIERRRIGPVIRALRRVTDPLFRHAGIDLDRE